jgi:uncharacterized protein YjbI with pentapeptide repeats
MTIRRAATRSPRRTPTRGEAVGHAPLKKNNRRHNRALSLIIFTFQALMSSTFIADQVFTQLNHIQKATYDACTFKSCYLAETDLTDVVFSDCLFISCDVSVAKVRKTAFRGVKFRDCKLLGLRFDTCHTFGLAFSFEDCLLQHASFYQLKLKSTSFLRSQLHEVDFSEADLSNANFDESDLRGAVFQRTNLEKADFRKALNYSIHPEGNRLKKTRFSLDGIVGLLDAYDIIIDAS